jgi:hypothetical protein
VNADSFGAISRRTRGESLVNSRAGGCRAPASAVAPLSSAIRDIP